MLCAIASEENAELVRVSAAFPRGDYMLVFDPLDGSSNIDVNINVGTIFSILRRKPGRTGEVQLDEILQPGSEPVSYTHLMAHNTPERSIRYKRTLLAKSSSFWTFSP